MAKLKRYKITKRIYPETLILFGNGTSYTSILEDKEILKLIHFRSLKDLNKLEIDYLVLQNLDIIKHQKFLNNAYKYYYLKVKLIALIERSKSFI